MKLFVEQQDMFNQKFKRIVLLRNYTIFAVNKGEAWVATFREVDINKVISRLSITRNSDMRRIPVVLLQSIVHSIAANQK